MRNRVYTLFRIFCLFMLFFILNLGLTLSFSLASPIGLQALTVSFPGSQTRLVRGTDARKKEHPLTGLGEIAQTVGQHSQHHPLHGSALPLLPLAASWPDP